MKMTSSQNCPFDSFTSLKFIIPPYIKMLDFHWIKAMLFSAIFPSPWYFFPAILSAVVFFRNTTAGGKK